MKRCCNNCRHLEETAIGTTYCPKTNITLSDPEGFGDSCASFELLKPSVPVPQPTLAPTTLTATYRAPDRGTLTLTATDGITRLDAHDWDISTPLQPVIDDFLKRLKP